MKRQENNGAEDIFVLLSDEHRYLENRLHSGNISCSYRYEMLRMLLTLKFFAYLLNGKVKSRPWLRMRPVQECLIESSIFDCEHPFSLTLTCEEWEDGPYIAIAKALTYAVMQGTLRLATPNVPEIS